MARGIITEETRRRLQEQDPKWRSKVILRMVATFFDFLAMVLFIVSVTMSIHWENVWNDGVGGDWTDGMPLASVGPYFGSSHFRFRDFPNRETHLTIGLTIRSSSLSSTTQSSSFSSCATAADEHTILAGMSGLISSSGPLVCPASSSPSETAGSGGGNLFSSNSMGWSHAIHSTSGAKPVSQVYIPLEELKSLPTSFWR